MNVPDRIALYEADRWGYTVQVSEGERVLFRYQASNNPLNPQGPSLSRGGYSEFTLWILAKEAASAAARAWGATSVSESLDLRPSDKSFARRT